MILNCLLKPILAVMTVAIISSANSAAIDDVWAKSAGKVMGINQDMLWTDEAQIDALIKLMKEAGVTRIRIPIRWVTVEPQKGKWDFHKADGIIHKLRKAHIEILGTLMSFPAWENGTTGRKVEGWYDTYPPESADNWAKYVEKVVSRYRKDIHLWEIWNEENGVDFWRPVPDVAKYMPFLKSAYAACKSANPKCVVVMGGLQMNGIIPNPWSPVKTSDFLQAIYDAGGKPYFDVVNIHPYVLPREGEGAPYMRRLVEGTIEVMQRNGDGDKPLWITEIGCGTNAVDTPEAQAKLLKESFDALYSLPQVKAVYWFCLKDYSQSITGPEDSMGMLTIKNERKPSFYAFQRAAHK